MKFKFTPWRLAHNCIVCEEDSLIASTSFQIAATGHLCSRNLAILSDRNKLQKCHGFPYERATPF